MKSKKLYFLLASGVILSGLFFASKLYEYHQIRFNDSHDKSFYLSRKSSFRKEFKFKPKIDVKNSSYYENLFNKKNIFKALAVKQALAPVQKIKSEKNLEQEFSMFELLGVVSSGGKSQALIENVNSGKTFYCVGGERLNGFVVKEVLDNKVILEQGDRTFELRL